MAAPLRSRWTILLGGVALLAGRPSLGTTVKAGTFTKTSSAAPAMQQVPWNLNAPPHALILWTSGAADGGVDPGFSANLGMTDGVTSWVAAASSEDAVTPSRSKRRIAAQVISLVDGLGTVRAEASLAAWSATDFTLNWTTNDARPSVIHYLAFGGRSGRAKVVIWNLPSAVGPLAVTGVPFQPSLVIHFFSGTTPAALPSTGGSGHLGIGVMTSAGEQWTSSTKSVDGVAQSATSRTSLPDTALALGQGAGTYEVARYQSMDPGGFTLNFSAVNAMTNFVGSLALTGFPARAGTFVKSTATAPATDSLNGIGFSPTAVLFASVGAPPLDAGLTANATLSIGASDGTAAGAFGYSDHSGLPSTRVGSADDGLHSLILIDGPLKTITAAAGIPTLKANGFLVTWSPNTPVADEVHYLVMGSDDAGTPEAGTPDAGTSDAGGRDDGVSDGGVLDAGASDGGTQGPGSYVVGCSSTGTALLWVLLLPVTAAARRRTRNARRPRPD